MLLLFCHSNARSLYQLFCALPFTIHRQGWSHIVHCHGNYRFLLLISSYLVSHDPETRSSQLSLSADLVIISASNCSISLSSTEAYRGAAFLYLSLLTYNLLVSFYQSCYRRFSWCPVQYQGNSVAKLTHVSSLLRLPFSLQLRHSLSASYYIPPLIECKPLSCFSFCPQLISALSNTNFISIINMLAD